MQFPSRTGSFSTRSPPEVPLDAYPRLAYHRLDGTAAPRTSRHLPMAKLPLADAARVAGVARSTLYRAIQKGRLSADADGRVDTAELLRAGYTLQRSAQQTKDTALHRATSRDSGTQPASDS